jgi:hypothetical protein
MERDGPVCQAKGEKGIQILAPLIGFRRWNKEAEGEIEADADRNTKPQRVLIGFRVVRVFDVSQTEGMDLPEFEHNISGEVSEHRDRLIDFLAQQNIALEFNERIAPALGVSYGGKIALLPGQSKAEEFTTLGSRNGARIVAQGRAPHLDHRNRARNRSRGRGLHRGSGVGLEMGNASSDYIQMYAGNATLLAESLEVIQRTSAVILAAIRTEEVAEQATEPEQYAAA